MQENVVVLKALLAHNGSTYLAEPHTMSPSATIKYEARWNGGAIGIWNLIAVSIKAHEGKSRTI